MLFNGPAILLQKHTQRKQRDGGVLGRERACASLRYDCGGVFVWRKTRIRAPGLAIGVGCANQQKRPVWHSRSIKASEDCKPWTVADCVAAEDVEHPVDRFAFRTVTLRQAGLFQAELTHPVSVGEEMGWLV